MAGVTRGGLLVAALGLAALAQAPLGAAGNGSAFTPDERRRILKHSPLPPPPPDETNAQSDDPAAARLGHFLFFETRLSGSGHLSCATCHDPRRSFADGRTVSEGARKGRRHTPALWNVAYNRWFFWDGRADSLWSQALQPLESPDEMAGSRQGVFRLFREDAALRQAYEAIFGPFPAKEDRAAVDRVFVNLGKAIAAHERRIVSRRAPFDVFVEGLRQGDPERMSALSPPAQRGLKLFVGRGQCRTCHAGPNFTDREFHDIGVPPGPGLDPDPGRQAGLQRLSRDEFGAGGAFSDDRQGAAAQNLRFAVQDEHARGQVKTPSLRNVALTAPYMHHGQIATLRDVLRHYSTLEGRPAPDPGEEQVLVPLHLTDPETADLLAFLESLTDDKIDPALLGKPAAPR